MQLSDATFGWNELDFLDEGEFRSMGPPIMKLEIERLERVMGRGTLPPDISDRLRRARFEIIRYVEALETGSRVAPLEELALRLSTAILNLGFPIQMLETESAQEIRYVTDRLTYIHRRMELIY